MRCASWTAPAARSLSSTPRARRSRWSFPTFRTPRCGRGPARRSSAWRPGPDTATPTASKAISSKNPACACSRPRRPPGTRRASSIARLDLASFASREPRLTNASPFVIDGAAIARGVLDRVAEETRALASKGVIPGLAVVLVGEDPASQSYVASKGKAAKTCGFNSIQHTLPRETSEAELLALVDLLNADAAVHGILVQLPLPKGIDSPRVLEAIAPHKDVDGFHPFNVGLLSIGEMRRAMVPCTPAGVMILVDKACEILGQTLPGKVAVIVAPA